MKTPPYVTSASILSTALIIASFLISNALSSIHFNARYVTVKGLAEKEVQANEAIWPIVFSEVSNELNTLQKNIDQRSAVITKFLQMQGFQLADISHGIPEIRDKYANEYNSGDAKFRYMAKITITLRSNDIILVKNTLEKSSNLIAKGVTIVHDWQARPQFIFTDLNSIKPAMIEEATLNARKAADKFAEDSGIQTGKILHASQGLFSINDTHLPEKKLVRIVTTIQYLLSDK